MSPSPHDPAAAESEAARRRRRRTWPSLVFTAAIVAFWTALIAAIGAMGAASLADPAERLRSALVFGGVVGVVLTGIGWVAQRIFLSTRRAPINDARNLAVILGVAVLGLAPAAFLARSEAIHRQVMREPGAYQATVIDDEYSRGIYDADAVAGLALDEALGREGLIGSHLRDRSSLPDLRARLERARDALNAHEARIADLQAEALDQVRQADMAEWERAQWLQSFNEGFDGTRPLFEQRYALHRRLFDLQEEQVALLERSRSWQVSQAGVQFGDPEDLAAYNDLAGQISTAVAELTALDQQAADQDAQYQASRPAY